MANALVRMEQQQAELAEQVIVGGDLSVLTPEQRVNYYRAVCDSVGLNPYTKPFEYIRLNSKLTLYARRDAADQLRGIHGISLTKPHIEYVDDMVVVTVEAVNKQGRTDADLGAVNIKGLQGEARANAIMKAITKAKRRVTLSLAGLGWLDETEVDSIPDAQRVHVSAETGEILDAATNTVETVTPYYAQAWHKLTGKHYDLVDWVRQLHLNTSGPSSKEQYGYVTGIIDALTNEQHNYVLSILCQSEISGDNKPSKDAASALIKHLAKTIKVKDEDGNETEQPNPKYRQDMADIITDIAQQQVAVTA